MKISLWTLSALEIIRQLAIPLFDPDLWWHLAAGRAMVQGHVFLTTDIFSHTMAGRPWINFEWLSEIILYGLVHVADLPGVYIAKILLSLAVLASLILDLRKLGARGPWILVASWCGFLLLRPRLFERIELVTLLGMGILLWTVLQIRAVSSRRWLPWFVFAVMVLWVNLHAGFILGIAFLVLLWLGAFWSGMDSAVRRRLGWCAILGLVAVFINPHGPRLLNIFLIHARQFGGASPAVEEWRVTHFNQAPYYWWLLVATIVLLVWEWRQERTRFWLPAILVFSVLGFSFVRMHAFVAFVSLPFCVEAIRMIWKRRRTKRAATAVGWLVIAAIVLFQSPRLVKPWPSTILRPQSVPVKACQFIREKNLRGLLFNSYAYGGYISWTLWPDWKIFMDGRYIFHPLLLELREMFNTNSLSALESRWVNFFGRYDVTLAVMSYDTSQLKSDSPFPINPLNIMFPRQGWALVYWDDNALVFLKRTPENEGKIGRLEYRSLWPYNLDQMAFLLKSGALKKAAVLADLERHEKDAGFSIVGNWMKSTALNEQAVRP